MKRILEVGDIIKIIAKDRKDAWLDYTVKIVEVTSRCLETEACIVVEHISLTETMTMKTLKQMFMEETLSIVGIEW